MPDQNLSSEQRELLELLIERSEVEVTTPEAGDVEAVASVELDPAIEPEDAARTEGAPRAALLTGATGFVGAFLLRELLKSAGLRVVCLIRASDEAEARQRLRRTLDSYLLPPDFADEADVVPGDLALPGLGLDDEQLDALSDQVDAIYHCGAIVSAISPFEFMRRPNVAGTEEMIRLACRRRLKSLHFISTIKVAETRADDAFVDSTTLLLPGPPSLGGYAQSKWAAEKLVATASRRGVPVTTYRLGRITGDSVTGALSFNDGFSRQMLSCLMVRKFPTEPAYQNWMPVDFTARAVVHLSGVAGLVGRAVNLVSPRSIETAELRAQAEPLLAGRGIEMDDVPFREWLRAVLDSMEKIPDHPMVAFRDAFRAGVVSEPVDRVILEGLARSRKRTLDSLHSDEVTEELAGAGIACPTDYSALADTYLGFLEMRGALGASGASPPAPSGDR